VAVEQYRRLAAAVHELQMARGLKTLMVTSAVPREGKTLTVTNLALTLSGSYGRRVLLIDADLRRPTIHEVLRLRNASGLNDLLVSGRNGLRVVEAAPRLHVLTAGRPTNNPMAALTSERMRTLLQEAEAAYDWILLDAPPVGIMPDAGLLAGITGACLLVIAAGSTPYKMVQRAVEELGRDCIVGTVLNRMDERYIPATDYYHQYYAPSGTDA
jgi:capsular exopolysaccharide synthesis family protein